jgi:glycopeptide antibiotics resistance protein
MSRRDQQRILRRVKPRATAAFGAYLVVLLALTFFPFDGFSGSQAVDLRLQAFRTINFALRQGIRSHEFLVLVGNLAAFVPVGLLLPAVIGRRSLLLVLVAGFGLSLAIEAGQLAVSVELGFAYRSADIDDVIVNVVGAGLGYVLFLMLSALKTRRDSLRPDRRGSY